MPMTPTRRYKRETAHKAPKGTMADYFKARFGHQNTAEARRCVICFDMLPDSDFDTPFTPSDTTVNICRGCEASRPASSFVEAVNARIDSR
jgi:hypothetical protein